MLVSTTKALQLEAAPNVGRIAFFMHGFEMGGAQKMTIALAGALARRGLPVDIVVASEKGPLRASVSEDVRVVALRSTLLSLARKSKRRTRVRAAIPALACYLREERPAVLVSGANHASIATVLAHLWARCPEINLVLRATNPLAPTGNGGSGLKRAIARLIFPHAHRIVAVSLPVADDHKRVIGLRDDQVVVIPEPAIDRCFADRLAGPAFHPWLMEENPLVLAIGRLAPQKDYPTLLRAWGLVQAKRPDARLLIVGDGPEREKLHQLRDCLCLNETVAFAGAVDNPLPALRYARCLALSSRWEGLGIVAIEAMAAGCNVVATDTPAVRWVLRDGSLGPLSPIGDAEALAASLLEALDAKAAAQPLQEATSGFTIEAVVHGYLELFEALQAVRPRAVALAA